LDVPCVCLDEEFPVDLPIKLLKIDVAGFEGHVQKTLIDYSGDGVSTLL
jgi:hypothetical protein